SGPRRAAAPSGGACRRRPVPGAPGRPRSPRRGVSQNTGTIGIAWGLSVQLIVLVVGLIMSIIEVWKSANQNSQKTKILNIVDDDAPKRTENKRVLQHLFEDEEL
ncbi:MAG: hypothetical protein HG439_003775, partial [candidate division SR1 bacterium]|nr:hypothetical protein [candidate division SR1 bacterium]